MPGETTDDAPLTIGISTLMSYEHTGAVRLECELGCSCEPRCRPWRPHSPRCTVMQHRQCLQGLYA